MSSIGAPSVLKDESTRNIRQLLKVVILFTIAGAAVSSRLFSVIRKLSPRFEIILGQLDKTFRERSMLIETQDLKV